MTTKTYTVRVFSLYAEYEVKAENEADAMDQVFLRADMKYFDCTEPHHVTATETEEDEE